MPNNDFNLDGKSLVLLGTNGKGKSALVDGIEFILSGQVSHFIGTGTGNVRHNEAIKNVKTGGTPKVTLSLSPSNGKISRSLSTDVTASNVASQNYIDEHLSTDTFILRRAKLLDFIHAQNANRYDKFVQLLGIKKVDDLQRKFVEAEKQAERRAEQKNSACKNKIAIFHDKSAGITPRNLHEVFVLISKTIAAFKLEGPDTWSDVAAKLPLLEAQRPQTHRKEIEAVTRALVSIEKPLPQSVEEDVVTANQLRSELNELAKSSADAPRNRVINEGYTYLQAHADETHCPLCETELEYPLDDLLARLRERSDALRELRDSNSRREAALSQIKKYADGVTKQIMEDLEHSSLLDRETTKVFKNAKESATQLHQSAVQASTPNYTNDLAIPNNLVRFANLRATWAAKLNERKASLVAPDSEKLEAAIFLLKRGIENHADITAAEQAASNTREILRRATLAKEAFTKAREKAIQQVFNRIAETVLGYYRRLHDFDDSNEQSECTNLELKSTSRSATGGLRLAIQFLKLTDLTDPRAFLSEGHLDSLGLCIFLAVVQIFNPPGSLLVLDDILTSIDKEHRRRVAELLLSDFQQFQIILTTHDEHWHDLLLKAARAQGLQGKWTSIKLEGWTVELGPVLSKVKGSWDYINEHLTEPEYRNLGGPFRDVIEDFLRRTAAKIELKVRFKNDGKYTVGDFTHAGIQDELRKKLIQSDENNEEDIRLSIARVFGQEDLINFLSHRGERRLEISFAEAKDFVSGLRRLTEYCEKHRLIQGQ